MVFILYIYNSLEIVNIQVSLNHFDQLQDGDVLFIDSSHLYTLKSDVRFEFADVLLRLKKGVIVHVHDMWQPCGDGRHDDWNEQELVMLILAYNPTWEVLWHGKCMHRYNPKVLSLMHGSPKLDHSLWMRKIF